jgi:MFS family permease
MASHASPADLDLTPPERNSGFGSVLRNRNFMLIWLAQGLSQIAYHAVNFALVVLAETITHSSTAVSLIILSFSLPAILFSGLSGVLVDRSSKRRVMVVTTALRTVVLACLIFVDTAWPWPLVMATLYLVTFVFSTLSQVFGPAEGALIPRLVGKRLLIAANSLFNITFFASQLIGFAVVGPVLAKLVGVNVLFQVATGLYAICTLLVWLLPADPPPPPDPTPTAGRLIAQVWGELVEGVVTIWRDKLLVKAIAYLSLATSAFLMLGAIGPAFVTRVLGIEAEDVGFIMAPAGLGIVGGIFLVNRLARPDNRERMIDLGILIGGLAMLVFSAVKPVLDRLFALGGVGLPPTPLVVGCVMVVAFVVGGSSAFILVPSQTILQERSPDEMRARVFAAFYTVSSAASLAPVLFAGALSDIAGVTQVLVLVAISFIAIGGLNLRRAAGAASAT